MSSLQVRKIDPKVNFAAQGFHAFLFFLLVKIQMATANFATSFFSNREKGRAKIFGESIKSGKLSYHPSNRKIQSVINSSRVKLGFILKNYNNEVLADFSGI